MADAMVQSAFTAPHVTEWVDVDMTRALAVLARLRDLPAAENVRVTPMTLVAEGLVRAAVRYPLVNSTWVDAPDGPHVHLHTAVHLGIAVDSTRGLVVPVVREADQLGIAGVEKTIADFGKRARDGALRIDEMQGGTFTISNGGVYGSLMSTPTHRMPRRANSSAWRPGPHPTSSTRSPGARSRVSTRKSTS
jgi:pyruvate/2-oxoglutarate dehydrogenase complex dihydrolipoamide acyltransferase (E2) component